MHNNINNNNDESITVLLKCHSKNYIDNQIQLIFNETFLFEYTILI